MRRERRRREGDEGKMERRGEKDIREGKGREGIRIRKREEECEEERE